MKLTLISSSSYTEFHDFVKFGLLETDFYGSFLTIHSCFGGVFALVSLLFCFESLFSPKNKRLRQLHSVRSSVFQRKEKHGDIFCLGSQAVVLCRHYETGSKLAVVTILQPKTVSETSDEDLIAQLLLL